MRTGKVLMGLSLIVVVALVALAPLPARAQDTGAMKQVGLVPTGSGTFSIDVEGADIRTVCRAVAEFSHRNIVVGVNVSVKVKISLHNVGWQEALRTILRSNGLDYVEENGILRVDDMSKLYQESVERETARAKAAEMVALETRIVKLNYANASELTAALQGSLTRRGTVLVERRTNSLIINDVPGSVEKVEKMAMDLDSTTPQIEITAKLVDVDVEALRDIGIEWAIGRESKFYKMEDPASGKFDKPVQLPPVHPGNDQNQDFNPSQETGIADPATRLTYGLFKNAIGLEAQLQMLEQNRKANIISNPRITTVDNREAKILVGQKIPLIVQDVAGNPVSQLQTIGIQLKVTPHLTADKKIIMDLHPEVSDLSTQSTVQGGVIINTSEADTRVMVDDGQTAVIGGLIRTNEGEVRRGTPFLKDLPLLGFLFRSNTTIHQNRELIIFVTPRLITDIAAKH
ncbi:MAG: type IV pilus secretin PilQ [Candidatus Eisenbacteria bacterium]|nr:type IV pilus secretin PilQ [Candidatus Eisenbacteria bacterium]